jgi:hypothetical protein
MGQNMLAFPQSVVGLIRGGEVINILAAEPEWFGAAYW